MASRQGLVAKRTSREAGRNGRTALAVLVDSAMELEQGLNVNIDCPEGANDGAIAEEWTRSSKQQESGEEGIGPQSLCQLAAIAVARLFELHIED